MARPLDASDEATALGRYELIAELASGGMATVYLARRSAAFGFQRLVAIKRLHPHLAKDGAFVDMFIDEARVAARIHHPNVVPIVDIETSGEGLYLVMEYIEGDTLARVLARSSPEGTPIPIGVCARIILDALAGLHAAHELIGDDGKPLQIVHRDVSPQNVLVGIDGVSRLADFGVAHASSRLASTRTGQVKGKLAYMAPEQAKTRKLRPIDRRADVFAMGIVLWEAASATRLFKGDDDAETLNRVLYEPIAPLRSVRPDAPEAVEAICARALHREPDDRFATAAEMADALERAAKQGGWLAEPREVAAHLERIFGVELAQNREALRQWTARSDLRQVRSSPPMPSSRRADLGGAENTRVEGRSPPTPKPAPPGVPVVEEGPGVQSARDAHARPVPLASFAQSTEFGWARWAWLGLGCLVVAGLLSTWADRARRARGTVEVSSPDGARVRDETAAELPRRSKVDFDEPLVVDLDGTSGAAPDAGSLEGVPARAPAPPQQARKLLRRLRTQGIQGEGTTVSDAGPPGLPPTPSEEIEHNPYR